MQVSMIFSHNADLAPVAQSLMENVLPTVPYDVMADGNGQAIVTNLDARQTDVLQSAVAMVNAQIDEHSPTFMVHVPR